MPFLSLQISHTATSHLSRVIGLSSKMVPVLMENCRWSWVLLHCHLRRLARNTTSFRPQVGQVTPLGQRLDTMKLRQLSGFEKWTIASCIVFGLVTSFMHQMYSQTFDVSSKLMP